MMYFCTLFDIHYINKGLALYASIEKCTSDFELLIMAMDRPCQESLEKCSLSHARIECIEDIMSVELDTAKSNRNRAEFCWTCGSYITDYFLNKYDLPELVYLDSDLMFFSSPQIVFDELHNKHASVGLTPHFTPTSVFGKYCVQFVYFKNDTNGVSALKWWKEACLTWCYSNLENGKFGDQKYLDYFAERFDHICEIDNRGVGIAYWNMAQYRYEDGKVFYKGNQWPIVFFHYSGINVSLIEETLILRHNMFLTKKIRHTFIEPYADLLTTISERYLNTKVSSVLIEPLSKKTYPIKRIVAYLNRILPIDSLVTQVMRIKHTQRRSLYSDK